MSVTLNAKGTSVPSFTIGKGGVTIYQGLTDPSLSHAMKDGDYWLNKTTNAIQVWTTVGLTWQAPRLADIHFVGSSIVAPGGQDLTLSVDTNHYVNVDSGNSGPALITTNNSQDLHINPATGGGQYLILCGDRWPAADGTNGQSLKTNGTGILSWYTPTVGTVTSASVVSVNGFAGSVATNTTTPAISLSTTVTGMVKANGTAISAATVGTDYSVGTSALGTGILKSTTTTGALSIAIAADFPTLNQSTSGTAAGLSATLAVSSGGTGEITSNAAFNNLAPSQVTNAGKFLKTDGTNTSWTNVLNTGTAIIDFGAYPGTTEASIAITGLTNILSTSVVILDVLADATSIDHTASDHRYFKTYACLTYSTPVTGTGFTIYSNANQPVQGKWTIRYSWVNSN